MTFAPGETPKHVTVAFPASTADEPDTVRQVTLSAPGTDAVLGPQAPSN